MAKITRAVKAVKSTAVKTAKTTTKKSTASVKKTNVPKTTKLTTYNDYIKKGKLTPKEAQSFVDLCMKRPFKPNEAPGWSKDYAHYKNELKSGELRMDLYYAQQDSYMECKRELGKAVEAGDARRIAKAVNLEKGIEKISSLFK